MHNKGWRMKINGTVILLAALLGISDVQAQQVPKVPVRTALVQQQDMQVWIRGIGRVKPKQSVDIRPQVDGVLLDILVKEGQMVNKGDLLAVLDDRAIKASLAQAKAQHGVIKAQLESARLDLQRFLNLSTTQAISQQVLDQQKALVQQQEAQLRSVEAAIQAQQVQLSFTRISSPVTGQVGIRNVDAGNYVRSGDNLGLFSVVQLDPISVEIALPQSRLPQLQQLMQQTRQQQQVPVQAFLQDGAELLAQGLLQVVDNKVAAGTGTVRVKADFANPDHKLWPEQTVVVALQQEKLPGVLTVPLRALVQGPDGPYVWLNEQGKAKTQPVQLVLQEQDLAVVSGLQAGQQVVVDGQNRLKPGAELAVTAEPRLAASKELQP